MLWIDEKYISLISSRLNLFRKVGQGKYVFRCPICGDSKKNKWKTRGGFYVPPSGNHYNMGCFNCGASMAFSSFLKIQDQVLYNEYIVEKYQEQNGTTNQSKQVEVKQETKRVGIQGLQTIASLPDDHPVVKYLTKRLLPKKFFDVLYFAPKYKEFVCKIESKRYSPRGEHPRLIIPFFNERGNITRISARAFGDEDPKYLYTVLDKTSSRLYGSDRVKKDELVYVLEGPLDSLFFDNAVAIGSADYAAGDILDYKNRIIIPDNEPRNKDVCKNIQKVVDRGDKVCLWNEFHGKDINDMIKNGMTIDDIMKLIEKSTVSGIEAQLKFKEWMKV